LAVRVPDDDRPRGEIDHHARRGFEIRELDHIGRLDLTATSWDMT
jgi:hypothetical protein